MNDDVKWKLVGFSSSPKGPSIEISADGIFTINSAEGPILEIHSDGSIVHRGQKIAEDKEVLNILTELTKR